MGTRKIVACLSFIVMCSSVALGQGGRLAKEADDAFKNGYFFNAIELYKKAYIDAKTAPDKAALIFKVGESYRALGDPQQSQVWYEKANKAGYNDPVTYLYIAQALQEQGKYADAISAYNKYKDKKPNDVRATDGIAMCQQAQKWQDAPSRYSVDPEVLLNSQQYDFSPAFADKKNDDIVFTSTRTESTGTETDVILGESFSDLFTSSRDKLGKWSTPVKLPPTIDSPDNEGAVTFNGKRTIMYFTRCPFEKNKTHGCDIWMSKKVGSNYSEPEKLALRPEDDKMDTITIGHPALTVDDGALIFASDMKGGRGGKDLWMVKLDKDGKAVGKPTNLGPEINTAKDDMFPFVRKNGMLYFGSDGYPGMGAMDIFSAEKTGDNAWGHVENMKAPINSSMDDFGIVFDGDAEKGYFTSNRAGGKGQDDIWRFYQPDLVFALQGTVYNKTTGAAIPGAKVEVQGTDGSSFNALTDDNGGFSFAENGKSRYIKENTTYSILVTMEGFLNVTDQVTTVGLSESTTFVKEYYMIPIVGVIRLPQVLYELSKWDITPQGADSLQYLYNVLTENPTLVINLRSHTDSRDSNKNNLILSQKRAQSCVNWLVGKGIDPARMIPVGRGEEELLISDAEIAKMPTQEEKEAAHQKNRRTDFTVARNDFVPGQAPPPPTPNN